MMQTLLTLSQSTKVTNSFITKDSVTISKPVFKSIIKESIKCDSLRSAFSKKDLLINDLINNNLLMYKDFKSERIKKNEAIKDKEKAEKALKKFNNKRFGIGISVGPGLSYLDSTIKIIPTISISLHYSIFRF